jgi:transposase
MNNSNIIFVGLDTAKEFSEVAYSLDDRDHKPCLLSRIRSTKQGVEKLCRQLQSKYPGATLHVVYEAGPCGYWIYRLLTRLGHPCYVIAPSLIPKKPGVRVKTDKRDALMLCQLLKNGDFSSIYVPEPEDEAIRDLSRARERAMRDLNDAKYQLKALLLRNHIHYNGTANWSVKHLRWLTELVLPYPAQHIVLQEMIQTVNERLDRLRRFDNELQYQVKQWRYYPLVKAYQAMRGVGLLVATGVVAELGDLTRFDTARKLMAYVGLVPSEHSTGGRRKIGGLTKTGNPRARRLLIEGAHSYRYAANISSEMQKQQEGLPKVIIDIGWKAQLRLCRRYQRLVKRGKHQNVIKAAIAREMLAYLWSMAKEVVLTPVDPKTRLARIPS